MTDILHRKNTKLGAKKYTGTHSPRHFSIDSHLGNIKYRLKEKPGALDKLGTPVGDGYLLIMWRGEWHEFYASWSNQSTLVFQRENYFQFGSALKDFLFLIFLFLIFSLASIWLWLESNRKKKEKRVKNG